MIKKYNQYIKENIEFVKDELDIYIQALEDEGCNVQFLYTIEPPSTSTFKSLNVSLNSIRDRKVIGYLIQISPDETKITEEPVPELEFDVDKLKQIRDITEPKHFSDIISIVKRMGEYLNGIGYNLSIDENDCFTINVEITKK